MSEKKENVVMDERTMIREQERLAKEAKQKKTKKVKIIVSVVFVAVLIGTIWYVGWGRSMFAQTVSTTTVKIEKSVGQEVVYAKITEINGNEITYAIAEEVSEEEPQSSEGDMPQREMPDMGKMPQGGMPDRSGESRGQGGMSFGNGEMPDMSSQGDMFFGGGQGRGQSGERPGRGNAVTTGSAVDQFVYDSITYRIGSETVTTYIPVGTDVTTKLGTVTTFSRLAADDYVALVMDKDGDEQIIAAVYIVG